MAGRIALFNLGFRPFFLGAGLFAVLSVLAWLANYTFAVNLPFGGLTASVWHAHEMVFGYGMAIIAGFMLTATKNWTGLQTLRGIPLLLLVLLWATARILPLAAGRAALPAMAVADCLFGAVLIISVAVPILRTRQYRQLIVLAVLLLLLASNTGFYIGVLRIDNILVYRCVYSGLYMVIALIIVMGGRVIPFFIERGVGYPVKLVNRRWIDIASLVLFLLYWITEVFLVQPRIAAWLAALLFPIHGIRMAGWYTAGIWKRPLLWILYLAYGALVGGFALRVAVQVWGISPFLAVHAYGYGCVGLVTLGMICRVSWGHTGRNIAEPPPAVRWMFALLVAGAIVRVVLPLFTMDLYRWWITLSQVCWILAFSLFLATYMPVLIRPRPDGADG